MAKFADLPNELLGRIVSILNVSSLYGDYTAKSAIHCLCRTSKRLQELAQPSLYRIVEFSHGAEIAGFFLHSGVRHVPADSLRSISIYPGEEGSFSGLSAKFVDEAKGGIIKGQERKLSKQARKAKEAEDEASFIAHLANHCAGVLYVFIALNWQGSNMEDNDVRHYLPLFKALNPKSILQDTDFSPYDMAVSERSSPSVGIVTLLDTFASYTRLACLRLPNIDFSTFGDAQLAILSRLPLEYVRLDWPSGLTVAKVVTIMDALPKLREKGFVISSQMTDLGQEIAFGSLSDGNVGTEVHFNKENKDLSLKAIETYIKAKRRFHLLDKLFWLGPGSSEEQYEDDKIYTMARGEQARV